MPVSTEMVSLRLYGIGYDLTVQPAPAKKLKAFHSTIPLNDDISYDLKSS